MVVCSFLAPFRPFFDWEPVVVDPAFRLVPAALFWLEADWLCDDAGLELFAAAAFCLAEDLVPAIVVSAERGSRRNVYC